MNDTEGGVSLEVGAVYRLGHLGEDREIVDMDEKSVMWRTVPPYLPAEGISNRFVFAKLAKERIG